MFAVRIREVVTHEAHNLEILGSIPRFATTGFVAMFSYL